MAGEEAVQRAVWYVLGLLLVLILRSSSTFPGDYRQLILSNFVSCDSTGNESPPDSCKQQPPTEELVPCSCFVWAQNQICVESNGFISGKSLGHSKLLNANDRTGSGHRASLLASVSGMSMAKG